MRFIEMLDTDMKGARDEMMRRLDRWGVSKALRRAGAEPGARVQFGVTVVRWK